MQSGGEVSGCGHCFAWSDFPTLHPLGPRGEDRVLKISFSQHPKLGDHFLSCCHFADFTSGPSGPKDNRMMQHENRTPYQNAGSCRIELGHTCVTSITETMFQYATGYGNTPFSVYKPRIRDPRHLKRHNACPDVQMLTCSCCLMALSLLHV